MGEPPRLNTGSYIQHLQADEEGSQNMEALHGRSQVRLGTLVARVGFKSLGVSFSGQGGGKL